MRDDENTFYSGYYSSATDVYKYFGQWGSKLRYVTGGSILQENDFFKFWHQKISFYDNETLTFLQKLGVMNIHSFRLCLN